MDVLNSSAIDTMEAISSRRESFKKTADLASECLKNKDYLNGKMFFESALLDLDDQAIGILELCHLEVFALRCCYLYCCIASDFISDEQLQALNLLPKLFQTPLVPYLKAIVLIGKEQFDSATDQLDECSKLLNEDCNFTSKYLNENIVPEMDTDFLQLKLNGLYYICGLLKANLSASFRERFKQIWLKIGQICDLDVGASDSVAPKPQVKNQDMSTMTTVRLATIQSQTDPGMKKSNAAVQTTSKKLFSVAVQTQPLEKNNNTKALKSAISGIKNDVNHIQSKKDENTKLLQRQLLELNVKLIAKDKKIWENDSIMRRNVLLERKLEKTQKETRTLSAVLFAQMQKRFEEQLRTLTWMGNECLKRKTYFSDIVAYLPPDFLLSVEDCRANNEMWRDALNGVENNKRALLDFQKYLNDPILCGTLDSLKTCEWPRMPNLPPGREDPVYKAFKQLILQENENCPEVQFNKRRKAGLVRPDLCLNGNSAEPWNRSSQESRNSPKHSTQPKATQEIETDSDMELFESLKGYFKNVDEMELLKVAFEVRESYPRSREGRSVGQLISGTSDALRNKRKEAASKASSTWNGDEATDICCMCIDPFNSRTCYILACGHEFHCKCIKDWLKQQKECPICGRHAVMDQDFLLLG